MWHVVVARTGVDVAADTPDAVARRWAAAAWASDPGPIPRRLVPPDAVREALAKGRGSLGPEYLTAAHIHPKPGADPGSFFYRLDFTTRDQR